LTQLQQGINTRLSTIKLNPLLNQFSRFRLTGSKSIQILQQILHPVHLSETTMTDQDKALSSANGKLFLELLDCEGIQKIWPRGGVLGFETLDCRELIFTKAGEASLKLSPLHQSSLIRKEESVAPNRRKKRLQWTEASGANRLQNFIEKPMSFQNDKLNSLRSQERFSKWTIANAIPAPVSAAVSTGEAQATTSTGYQHFSFPVLVIRNQGSEHSLPLTSSSQSPLKPIESMDWDLILPSSCAMIVWIALAFAGGRSTGLEETGFINHCLGIPDFPSDFPDTPAGKKYWLDIASSTHSVEAKRPKNKKTIPTSLSWPRWNHLYTAPPSVAGAELDSPVTDPPIPEEASTVATIPDFVVIRNMEYLSPFLPPSLFHQTNRYSHRKSSSLISTDSSASSPMELEPLSLPFRTTIRVVLLATGRGIPQRGAQLFSPSVSDYEQWIDHRSRRNHKTIARGRRVADWWGTDSSENRELIGFVTSSVNSSLSRNPRFGIGFCEALSLREMLHAAVQLCVGEGQLLVMFRNPQSKWHRPGLIQIQTF
jgi:hypothetical protein